MGSGNKPTAAQLQSQPDRVLGKVLCRPPPAFPITGTGDTLAQATAAECMR